MMSIKTVNALSHYTDWTIGHVHSGALGWVGFITMGSLYYLIPRLVGRIEMHSVKATYPFYAIRLAGGLLYLAGMVLMAWNVTKTVLAGKAADAPIPAMPGLAHA